MCRGEEKTEMRIGLIMNCRRGKGPGKESEKAPLVKDPEKSVADEAKEGMGNVKCCYWVCK